MYNEAMRLLIALVFATPMLVFAAEPVSFATSPLWLSTTHTTEGTGVRVQTVVMKSGDEDVSGSVTFYADGKTIGTTDFSLPSSVGGVVVSTAWAPTKGVHSISAKITKATRSHDGKEENIAVSEELRASDKLIVDPDNDRDGISDAMDPDDDNDGVSDIEEKKNGTDPLIKNVPKAPEQAAAVSMASTSDMVSKATDIAKTTGFSIFDKTETFRTSAGDYFQTKLDEAVIARAKKIASATTTPADDNKIIVAQPKSIADQLKDTSGMLEGVKVQLFKILTFIFKSIYAFYIVLIFLILWILRKIWKRYSLD